MSGHPLRIVVLLATALILTLTSRPTIAESSSGEVKRLLKVVRQDQDPEAWSAAVRSLREEGEEAQKLLDRELRRLHRKSLRDLTAYAQAIDRLGGDTKVSSGAESAREAWEKACRSARDFIYDEAKLPDATNEMVISDGWQTAFGLGAEAERAFLVAERSLRSMGERIFATSPDAARKLRADHLSATAACRRVGKELGAEDGEPVVRVVSWAVLEIVEGEFARAADRFAKMPAGRERLIVFYAYSAAILAANDRQLKPINRSTGRGMRELNRYRIALGRSPMFLNPKLMRAARGHSEEMLRLKYFGHDSPIRERRNENDRARLAGYGGSVSENIYAAASMGRAIPVWKKSGRHHRTMLLPDNVECGVSAAGPVTLVLGAGEEGSPPTLTYLGTD